MITTRYRQFIIINGNIEQHDTYNTLSDHTGARITSMIINVITINTLIFRMAINTTTTTISTTIETTNKKKKKIKM